MIQTKEELFLAELGINTKEEIELVYGAKIKITDLLKKYEAKQLSIQRVVGQSEQLVCYEQIRVDGKDVGTCVKCGIKMEKAWQPNCLQQVDKCRCEESNT